MTYNEIKTAALTLERSHQLRLAQELDDLNGFFALEALSADDIFEDAQEQIKDCSYDDPEAILAALTWEDCRNAAEYVRGYWDGDTSAPRAQAIDHAIADAEERVRQSTPTVSP